jgi:hypothetical protein
MIPQNNIKKKKKKKYFAPWFDHNTNCKYSNREHADFMRLMK